jgi:hypothetical protein
MLLIIFAGFWATLIIVIVGAVTFALIYFLLNRFFGK